MTKGLHIDDLSLCLGAREILSLTADVPTGTVLSIMGPSGAGKSTLLAALTGTLAREFTMTGRVFLDGRDITQTPTEAREIGILFQDDLLFPHLNVAENLAFGLCPGGTRATRRAAVNAALAKVGLAGYGPRDPATLSGGQKARVALMRTLLSKPRALLLDEAFSGLDPDRRAQIRTLVFEQAHNDGLPVVMVTHDPGDAEAAGGPILTIG